ncbi:family 43 glycosylhydrolase [Paenibacillus sp. JNUCC31]|uniref:glycoside hydrolase family 43 protein n=1 Tax=Paenibacillus sp. JNUCC-31 TaxID=2777983 RepID=UPI001783CF36|nr:glycoside hydrolase family 43 protein [Paenibacillus sp. JNUCC-31]QOS79020.1 family 43 glycosylhydrolase [Paenibacillus sp. JNUCC-31]
MKNNSVSNASEQTEKSEQSTYVSSIKAAIGKMPQNGNPLVAHKFGADPYALVFNNRVYLYMTSDTLEHDADGLPQNNSFKSINRLTIISSDDLLNWIDHGEIQVAGPQGAATWATQSWAPAAAHQIMDGEDRFFLYFSNNGSGIGVLSAPSPVGPWTDPIGKALITSETPGVEGVPWVFDPAVLVDDDHRAYIYFGGGVPEGKAERPDTARVMPLGEDMTSVVGRAKVIPAPYMFEDAGIHKYNNIYYFTYCSNFHEGIRPEGSPPAGEIAYMTSDQPMGPWTYRGSILKNPGHFFGVGGNNHHAIFQFAEHWYMAYHAQTLSQALDVPDGYRSTHLNRIHFGESDGHIYEMDADYQGVDQVKLFNPFQRVNAATMGWSAGVKTVRVNSYGTESSRDESEVIVTDMENGSWIALSKVDFGHEGAASFSATISNSGTEGFVALHLDHPDGPLIGQLLIQASDMNHTWQEYSAPVTGAQGVHDLYIVVGGRTNEKPLIHMSQWRFDQK